MSLKFQIESLDCNHSEQLELDAETFLNEDGDYICNFVNGLYFCNRICSKCKNCIYINLKKLYRQDKIKKLFLSTE